MGDGRWVKNEELIRAKEEDQKIRKSGDGAKAPE